MVEKIIELAIDGVIPAEIYRQLRAHPLLKQFQYSIKTVERIAKVHKPPTPKAGGEREYWNLLEGDSEDAAHVLEAHHERIFRYRRSMSRPEKWETQIVARLLKIAPEFPKDTVWFFARVYGVLVKLGVTTAPFDDYLGFFPWRSEIQYDIYLQAIQRGWISPVPTWEVLVEQQNPKLSFQERQERIESWTQQEDIKWQA